MTAEPYIPQKRHKGFVAQADEPSKPIRAVAISVGSGFRCNGIDR
ncbi:hypothetical protein L838_5036 [Mycobacterium avium MAV_120709_2344]|nr:hypothetical protein L838_5036 [Mycobacterium avium MAV_120709_2344]